MNWAGIPKQTLLKENGEVGDCWRCCVAAILGVDADCVPHFLQEEIDGKGCMDGATQKWLYDRGHTMIRVSSFVFNRLSTDNIDFPITISAGPTVRSKKMGDHHAVVMQGHNLLYDPHPSEAGLTAITEKYLIFPKQTHANTTQPS